MRKYDISKKTDLRRFERDIEKEIKKLAKDELVTSGADYDCPRCGKTYRVKQGDNVCPHCGFVLNVNFDFSNF